MNWKIVYNTAKSEDIVNECLACSNYYSMLVIVTDFRSNKGAQRIIEPRISICLKGELNYEDSV